LIYTLDYGISQDMGVPAKLTEKQIKFAELLVFNEGRKSPSECAFEAGYKTRARQAASELRNPKYSPLVVKYIGELRAEVQEKYGVNFERHVGELAKIRDEALKKGCVVCCGKRRGRKRKSRWSLCRPKINLIWKHRPVK
jgi:hypothetical protein